MDKKVRLGANKPPEGTPLKPQEVDLPGLKGTLPFASGKSLTNSDRTPTEVQDEERRVKEAPIVTPQHMIEKAITPPPPVDFDDLTPEKQAEELAAIKRVATKPQVKKEAPFIPRGPGIGEAKMMADKAAKQIEEKLKNPNPQKYEPAIKEEESPAVEVMDAGVAVHVPDNCPRCGWAIGKADPVVVERIDKQIFVAAVLGQKRFTKEYSLLNNQLKVVFRSLTTNENDLIIKQLTKDWNEGRISGPAHSVAHATHYQLTLSLESIETNIGPIQMPELSDYEYDANEIEKDGTVIPLIVDYVTKNALPTDSIRRIVSRIYGSFIDLMTKLEAMADKPDFWLATAD